MLTSSLILLSSLLSLSLQGPIHKRSAASPVLPDNLPDPSLIQDPSDGSWYAFTTSSNGRNIPVAHSTDFNTWTVLPQDALPTVGTWSNGQNVWAPDVIQLVSLVRLTSACCILTGFSVRWQLCNVLLRNISFFYQRPLCRRRNITLNCRPLYSY